MHSIRRPAGSISTGSSGCVPAIRCRRFAPPRWRWRRGSRWWRSTSATSASFRRPDSRAGSSRWSGSRRSLLRRAGRRGRGWHVGRRSTAGRSWCWRGQRRRGHSRRRPSSPSAGARNGRAVKARPGGSGEAADAVSPRIEETAPGLVYVDVSGLESLIGDDRAVARELVAAAERVGVRAAVGVAASKSVARLAARAASADLTLEATRWGVGGGAFRVVSPQEQREFLAGLPLDALELPDELRESLRRFGPQTLGEVASLPPGPLAARLGPEAALLSRLARGEDTTALAPRAEPERFEEGEELEWDASSVEPLLFVWKALLDRLVQRLCARGLMARELYLQLRLADGSWDERP